MKKFAFAALVVLFSGLVMAETPEITAEQDQALEEAVARLQKTYLKEEAQPRVIASCSTSDGKKLRVSLDEERQEFMVNYSENLEDPDKLWVKKTNDMFWSREYNEEYKVEDKELYASFGDQFMTFAVTDLGYDVLVAIKVEGDDQQTILLDGCKSIERLSLDDKVVANMTWVSNNENE